MLGAVSLEAFTCVNIHLLPWNGMFLMSLPSESVVQSSIRLWMSKAGGSLTPQSSALALPAQAYACMSKVTVTLSFSSFMLPFPHLNFLHQSFNSLRYGFRFKF